jgi:hypothetical protein
MLFEQSDSIDPDGPSQTRLAGTGGGFDSLLRLGGRVLGFTMRNPRLGMKKIYTVLE